MYRARSKRSQRIRFLLTYTLVPVLIVGIVSALTFYVLGYRLSADRTVAQGGLVQFDSYPSGATAYLGEQKILWSTATRSNAPAGSYIATMQKTGYKAWQKTVIVQPGKILWLDYARLVPVELTTTDVASYSALGSALAASSSDVIAVISDKTKPDISVVTNLSGTPRSSTVTIPATIFTAAAEGQTSSFDLSAISANGRWLSVVHTVGDTKEWIIVDRTASENTRNVSTEFGRAIESIIFDSDQNDRIYIVAGASLYRMNVDGDLPTASLATTVSSVRMNRGGVVSFITADTSTNQRVAAYLLSDSTQQRRFAGSLSLAAGTADPRDVLVSRFSHYDYAVSVYGDTLKIEQINKNTGSVLDGDVAIPGVSLQVSEGYDRIEVSPDGRFVAIFKDGAIRTYDLEIQKLSAVSIGSTQPDAADWLDNSIIWAQENGQLSTREFDGENANVYGSVIANTPVRLSENQEYIYSFRTVEGKPTLFRYNMLVR